MKLQPMYQALTNSPDTAITGDISADSIYITVMSASAVPPDLPNLMTLGKTDTAETVRVLEIDENTLTVERGADGMARAWKAGTVIARTYTAVEHNGMIENILQTNALLAQKQESFGGGMTWDNFDGL